MNGIGITQWQNNETEYPLLGSGSLSGIFCDASFVSYDGFIPVLNTVLVTETTIAFNITMDDGNHIFNFNTSGLSPGSSVRLRTSARSYGTLVFGRLTNDIITGTLGDTINPNCRFDPSVVRTIDSTNGVYSINGLSGNITVALDTNLIYNTSSYFGSPSLSAVSSPNNLDVVATFASNAYVYTSNRQLQLVDISNNTLTNKAILDKFYNVIFNDGTHLIGALVYGGNSTLYNITSSPASALISGITGNIVGLATDNSDNLWALIGSKLFNLGTYPYSYSSGSGIDIGLTGALGLTYLNGNFLTFVAGLTDYSTSPVSTFSNMIYSIIVSGDSTVSNVLGLLNDPTVINTLSHPVLSLHVPALTSMYVINGQLYGCSLLTNNANFYQIDPISLNITLIFSPSVNLAEGSLATVFVGGATITLNSVIPLKSINGVTVNNNQITITGADTLSIAQTAGDTLTFNLPINDSVLNINRSITYE